MKYNLFLDDIRLPHTTRHIHIPNVEWTIVRNYDEFVDVITKNGLPEMMTLDHDLGFEHYPLAEQNPSKDVIPYDTYKEKTGYHCVQWLIEYCKKRNLRLPKWQVHSMNVVGKQNMIQILKKYELEFK